MNRNKRILSIQDISCLGQCSLTAALPVISACGAECCVLPTAVLSTHTGACFSGYTFRDLTEDIPGIVRHWRRQGIRFDGIGIGYLCSLRQIQHVSDLIDALKGPETMVFLDPVMGDNGRFYTGFDFHFAEKMAALCAKSDVILPNLTEAMFLLGEDRVPEVYDRAFCLETARRLSALGAGTVILTGLDCDPGQAANLLYDCASGEARWVSQKRLPGKHAGTGDLFASACLGQLARGRTLHEAVERAGAFVAAAIANTEPEHNYGVRFEGCLGMLIE